MLCSLVVVAARAS